MIDYAAPDLTQHPPRSPRARLGGFVHLPRLLDKVRAHLRGRRGDYVFPCPLDERFFTYTGINADTFVAAVAEGRSDAAMLTWVRQHLQPVRTAEEIHAWSAALEAAGADNVRRHATFAAEVTRLAAGRDDVQTTFDRLELDDYVSFGGRG